VHKERNTKQRTIRFSRPATAADKTRAAWSGIPHGSPLPKRPDESDGDWVARNWTAAEEREEQLRSFAA
jgi:hypothetical protein